MSRRCKVCEGWNDALTSADPASLGRFTHVIERCDAGGHVAASGTCRSACAPGWRDGPDLKLRQSPSLTKPCGPPAPQPAIAGPGVPDPGGSGSGPPLGKPAVGSHLNIRPKECTNRPFHLWLALSDAKASVYDW
jgi:hypothetical protein